VALGCPRVARLVGRSRAMRGGSDSGQATVEWVGLLLAVGLALGALAGGVRGATGGDGGDEARGLGEAVAKRITCAARDLCEARGGGAERLGSPAPRGAPPAPRRAPPHPPRAAPPRAAPPRSAPPTPPRSEAGALPTLGRVGSGVAEHAWLVCFGYRSLKDDLEHPRTPREARPLKRTLEIVNECLNPWEFFFGG
jgi:hypothetical protein